jgi:hypothetical protein
MATFLGKDQPEEFQCAHCGAVYEVTTTPLPSPTKQEAVCAACRLIMNEWRGNVAPFYANAGGAHLGKGDLRWALDHKSRSLLHFVEWPKAWLRKSPG